VHHTLEFDAQSETVGDADQESRMSSTHEPPQLLEPTNLLEPLDLKHQHGAFAGASARGDSGAPAQRRFTRDAPRAQRPSEPARRSPVKSVVLAAGALACFGAGTLFSHVDILTPSDVGSSPTIASANHPPAPLADVATKSDESIQTEGKSVHSGSNEAQSDAASNAGAAPPPTTTPAERNGSVTGQGAHGSPAAQPATNDTVAPVNDAVAGCTGSCKQQACPPDDANCLEGGAPSPAKALTNADGSAATPASATSAKAARPARQAAKAQAVDGEHADSRASSREEERAQPSHRSKRAVEREAVDQATSAKRKVATDGGASRKQNANRASAWRRDFASDDGVRPANSGRWQSRDADQGSNGWGDWASDDVPVARSSRRATNVDQAANWRGERAGEGRWQEREWDRASSRRRERSDEYGRDDDRRFRGGRDDFLMGRAERSDGSPMMFPPTRYRW
jgi:hypothetical protein